MPNPIRYPGLRGAYGIPLWMEAALSRFHKSPSARARVLMRFSRMARVLDGRRRSLAIGRMLYQDLLAQNPGENEDLDFPD